MKNRIFLLLALVIGFAGVQAQTLFQGKLTYKMELTGEGAEMAQAMMPNALVISVYKTKMLTEFEGGMLAAMLGKTLSDTKKGIAYMIKDSEEMIYVMDPKKMKEDDGTEEAPDPVVTKENETLEIAGLTCEKYKVVQSTSNGESTSYVWVTEKYTMPTSKNGGAGGMGGMVATKGLPGMPLKVETAQGPVTVVLLAKEVSFDTPDKAKFKLPKGYKQEPFDANTIMGGM